MPPCPRQQPLRVQEGDEQLLSGASAASARGAPLADAPRNAICVLHPSQLQRLGIQEFILIPLNIIICS